MLRTFGILFLIIIISGCQQKSPPNVVFILIDDLGWTDLSCYGSSFYETPNIDHLAAEGILFTDAYAAASICSPTRASILTGKYPARLNMTDWIPGGDPQNRPLLGAKDRDELPLNELTLAEALKIAGYNTAFFGKWHLGDPGFFPEDQGFDINKGGHWAGQPASYFYPYKNDRERWDVPGLEDGVEDEYLTDRLTEESLDFIQKNEDQPFFLYLAHYAVHTPIQSKPDLTAKYEQKRMNTDSIVGPAYLTERESQAKQKQDNPKYAGMVQSVDESVGKIMSRLEELGLSKNTIIVFTSDNGGLSTLPGNRKSPTSVTPLRAGKGWLYEGGIRVPLIMSWPGKIKAGQESNAIVTSTDFYPTILSMLDLPFAADQHLDGVNLHPLLVKGDTLDRSAIFWHFPHYHGSGNKPSAAVRAGDYKLIEWYEDETIELYNLDTDIKEQHNLVDSLPQVAQGLHGRLSKWREEIGAHLPTKNVNYKELQND